MRSSTPGIVFLPLAFLWTSQDVLEHLGQGFQVTPSYCPRCTDSSPSHIDEMLNTPSSPPTPHHHNHLLPPLWNLSKTKPWWIWWLSQLATLKPFHQTADAFNRVPVRECSPWTLLSAGSLESLEGGSFAVKKTAFTSNTNGGTLCMNGGWGKLYNEISYFSHRKIYISPFAAVPYTLACQCPPDIIIGYTLDLMQSLSSKKKYFNINYIKYV